jgi:hypothetical protein
MKGMLGRSFANFADMHAQVLCSQRPSTTASSLVLCPKLLPCSALPECLSLCTASFHASRYCVLHSVWSLSCLLACTGWPHAAWAPAQVLRALPRHPGGESAICDLI